MDVEVGLLAPAPFFFVVFFFADVEVFDGFGRLVLDGEELLDIGSHTRGVGPADSAGHPFVVLDPVLSCAVRGLPECDACRAGRTNRCDHITSGHLAPGMQTGYCADTGGGWAQRMVAHEHQLRPVPDDLPDERAVLVEPLACAIHSVPGPLARHSCSPQWSQRSGMGSW